MSFIIAIDGPAGSGKGTLANIIAKDLNFTNIDTGATYRCIALATIENNIDFTDKENIINLLSKIEIEIEGKNENQKVFLNGRDVTKEIRNKKVTEIVSQVSAIKEVRIKLVEFQRKLAENKSVVMDGRDIGTYVFPNADIKIYLDADIKERAKRRFNENVEKRNKMYI